MEIEGKVVVVTGGASGIGAAMVERFRAEGAARVIAADLQGGGDVVRCDVSREEELTLLLREAGDVDLFCANAGVGTGELLGDPGEWELSWRVNVQAHIAAARLLLPGWLERGSGWFLSTASAAGLLAQIGSAPYSVTKHAAVAFAEWLSITYGDRGIGVSCLCPMAVETPLLRSDPRTERVVRSAGATLPPEEVAEIVVEALRDERFLILPHPEVAQFEQFRVGARDKWLAGMRRLQAAQLQA